MRLRYFGCGGLGATYRCPVADVLAVGRVRLRLDDVHSVWPPQIGAKIVNGRRLVKSNLDNRKG